MTRAERRYLVPEYEEQTSYGRKDTNPYNRLFEDRIVFLGAPVDDISANDVTAQMLALEGMDPDQYIIGFIHRYDTATNNWYLAGERFTFNGYSGPGDYPIASTNTLFNILPDGTVGNYDGGLQPYNGHLYDPVYFNSVMSGNIPLDPAIYVNRVTFAWEELKQLHCDNKSHIPGADDNLFSISFCGISADYSAYVPAAALIPFPHCVAMYMSYNGVPLLNDDPIVSGAMFANKAADMDCICPPKCDAYSWPTGLEPKNC
jgi:hypothetical protein